MIFLARKLHSVRRFSSHVLLPGAHIHGIAIVAHISPLSSSNRGCKIHSRPWPQQNSQLLLLVPAGFVPGASPPGQGQKPRNPKRPRPTLKGRSLVNAHMADMADGLNPNATRNLPNCIPKTALGAFFLIKTKTAMLVALYGIFIFRQIHIQRIRHCCNRL